MTRESRELAEAIAKGVKDALKSTSVKIEQPQAPELSLLECAKKIKDHCVKCGESCNDSTCELFSERGCVIMESVPEEWGV